MSCRFRSLAALAAAAALYQRLVAEGFELRLAGGCIAASGPRPLDGSDLDVIEDWLLTWRAEGATD